MALLSRRLFRFPSKLPAAVAQPFSSEAGHDAKTGSSYENYNETSKTYDNFRAPVGMNIMHDALARTATQAGLGSIKDVNLLDAGCGSGTYLDHLKGEVKTVRGLEFNDGMIAQATKKGLDVTQGSITDMPFPDGEFDAAITTQVLHHLVAAGGGGKTGFSNIGDACKEVYRCLKPKGAWIVNTQTPEQHVDGFWWAPVVPKAAKTLSLNFPEVEELTALLKEAGFQRVETFIPPEPLVRLDMYLDIEGPFSSTFRAADSTWALADEQELADGLAWLRAKIDAGEAEAWLAEREAIRARIGQTTTVVASKV